MSSLGMSLSGWLNRPYLDLGPAPEQVPNHTAALGIDCRSLFDGENTPWFWSSLNPSFREALIAETGLSAYDVSDPTRLAPELRTERWQHLCTLLEGGFTRLSVEEQVKVARLLNRMCFFRYVRDLIPPEAVDRAGDGPAHAALAWLRCAAGYKLWMEDAEPSYSLDEFERITKIAPPGLARINPLYQMVVQNVKHRNDVEATEYWQERHHRAILEAEPDLDRHDFLMAISRSHRVGGFVPQMRRDRAGTVREMDLAEDYARQMDFGTELQRAYARELLYPVRESRIKEALWLQDLDTALERAVVHRDAHPLDSRVWVHCGEVRIERDEPEEALHCFREAARLAPPGGDIARYMAGQCHEYLDDLPSALDAYLGALRVDPLGYSSAEGALRVAKAVGSGTARWAERAVAELTERGSQTPQEKAGGTDAYRNLPAPETDAHRDLTAPESTATAPQPADDSQEPTA
ncbi:hypothetical protein [Streptomyces sp. NBC_01022]|uniref:hypothetical protein n=1 Tax=Streptomyces sp. NBC_01022 TaxID=2903723 RepID=UPI002DDAC1AB|nr:hypothetical protein [Streptomyces sp. NBC_01022]WRZ84047.1 hypothetical protein OG316_29220 [Streptomyces sp. NBC_01022]